MANVTWVADVEGPAGEKWHVIGMEADYAGDQVEEYDRKTREASAGSAASSGGMIGLWQAVAAAIVVTGGAALALGAAFGGILTVGILALHGLSGGFGTLTSEAQGFRFELETLQQTTLQHLAAAAQSGLGPITAALKAIKPELEALAGPVKNFSDVLGGGLAAVMEILTPLIGKLLDFGNLALQGLAPLKEPLKQFADQMGDVLQRLNDTGQTQAAMSGIVGIITAILQVAPPLVEALVRLSAAFGPGLAQAMSIAATVLTGVLNLISAFPGPVAAAVVAFVGFTKAAELAGAALKALGAAEAAADIAAMANPIGITIALVAALAATIYLIGTHWDEVKTKIGQSVGEVGNAFKSLGGDIGKVAKDAQGAWDDLPKTLHAVGYSLGQDVGHAINDVIKDIQGLPSEFDRAMSDAGDKVSHLGDYFDDLGSRVGQFFSALPNAVGGAINAVGQTMYNIGRDIVEFFNTIYNALMAPINAIASIGSGFMSGVSSVLHLAEGGIATQPTLAVVGDAGPEAVIPLSRMGNLGGGGGDTYNIHMHNAVVGNELQVARFLTKTMQTARSRGAGINVRGAFT